MRTRIVLLWLALGLAGCDTDTVELGAACHDSAQCKAPSDTCMLVAGKQRCTMACSKEQRCPSGYVCPVTDPANRAAGSCLPAAELGPNVVKAY
ncbi:MAG: hypothetical protein IAG13_07600 [Deltaproteobacteria bacterium]|nr:hypothetical protein [Nannocystaceae bacterium]